jgi:hypothetical protein
MRAGAAPALVSTYRVGGLDGVGTGANWRRGRTPVKSPQVFRVESLPHRVCRTVDGRKAEALARFELGEESRRSAQPAVATGRTPGDKAQRPLEELLAVV